MKKDKNIQQETLDKTDQWGGLKEELQFIKTDLEFSNDFNEDMKEFYKHLRRLANVRSQLLIIGAGNDGLPENFVSEWDEKIKNKELKIIASACKHHATSFATHLYDISGGMKVQRDWMIQEDYDNWVQMENSS